VCFRWTVFQHNFIKMDYAWNIIVLFVFNRRYKLFMNVLKNKYIHIVNNIVCVFQMSIIMQILSMYVTTDKQKDVSHDVIMVKCYKFCYYLYIHVHRGIFLLPILPNFHYYAYYYKLQANIR
jgi:hypothetical protein